MENTIWTAPEIAFRLETALLSGTAQRLGVIRRNNFQVVNAVTMLVHSGAMEKFVDNNLLPEAESLMLGYTVLDEPKEIVTTGSPPGISCYSEPQLTGILPGFIADKADTNHAVSFPSLIVPGLGRNLFSSSDTATRVIKIVIEARNSRLEQNDIILTLKQRKKDMGLFSFQVELETRGSSQNAIMCPWRYLTMVKSATRSSRAAQ